MENKLQFVKNKLDQISPTMCLAMWSDSHIHLQSGRSHSCCKGPSDIITGPDMHNTPSKIAAREKLLNGEKPSECNYCWQVEDANKTSDRLIKSLNNIANYDDILKSGNGLTYSPNNLEVSFSNTCNFKCAYCSPAVSSKWAEESAKYGPYPTDNQFGKLVEVNNRSDNPLTVKFWEWLPNIYDSLNRLRVTGGEPLLDKNLDKILDFVKINPNKNLNFGILTNLNVPADIIAKLVTDLRDVIPLVKSITLYTSADAHGEQAEYIRYGMNYNEWLANVRVVIESVNNLIIYIQPAYGVLSVTSYLDFLKDVLDLKRKFGSRIILNTEYIQHPYFLSFKSIPQVMYYLIDDQINFMRDNSEFTEFEINKVTRIRAIIEYEQYAYSELIKFLTEYDRRKGTSFKTTFPLFEA